MPTVFVAFGVTGDLMKLKIIPALFALHAKGDLPHGFEIIGVSRREWDDTRLREHVAGAIGEKPQLGSFLQRFYFLQGDVSDKETYRVLAQTLKDRLGVLYFSLSPALYERTFTNLVHSPLAQCDVRLMIEKPFGTSEESAHTLSALLHKAFSEEQIFRVDHYLAKESLRTLPEIDPSDLVHIRIMFFETNGVEKRGASYDSVGALRDVGQNHALEMLAMALSPSDRAQMLEELPRMGATEIAEQTARGQYEGYQAIAGVAPESHTETDFRIVTQWRHVGVVLEGGKRMARDTKGVLFFFADDSREYLEIEENQERTEYEQLLLDCLNESHTLFVGEREVAALWRFIDPIVDAWKQDRVPLGTYQPGSSPLI